MDRKPAKRRPSNARPAGGRRSAAGRRPRATAAHYERRELQSANQKLDDQLRMLRHSHKLLEETRARYAELFDFAPAGYALLDSVGLILNANLAACRLMGVARRFLVGHPILPFVIEPDRRELLEHLRRCRAGHTAVESEVRLSSGKGKHVTCRLHSKRGSYEGREVFPTVIVDQSEHLALDQARLTAERQRDQAERDAKVAVAASAMKDRFLAVVSHELRTPLTPALFAASRLVGWSGLSDDAKKLALAIKRNIEFEARLIDDLLDVARINQNRLDLQLETVDVHEVIREAIATCRAFAQQNRVDIHTHLAAAEHHASADRGRLRQVFWNLLNNAIKFSETGGRITIGSSNRSDTTIRVTVRDEGIGIEPAVLGSLFAAFERKTMQHGSRSGLGLGLAICKGIVASHGGEISVSSEGRGRGSTFAVDIGTVEPGPQQPRGVEKQHILPSFQALRVLIVEDDRDSRDMLSLFLASEGCEVAVAPTLAEGLRQLNQQWDVVVSDLGLPDGSGLEVARQALHMPQPPKRLIALTGYGSSDDIKGTREAGFHAHVVKPIDLDQLLSILGANGGDLARSG